MRKALWLLFTLSLPALAQDPVLPAVTAIHPVPTLDELPSPESLWPCCASGYDPHARAVGIPVPIYQIGDVLTPDTLGKHHYNDSAFGVVKNLLGLNERQNGLIYTRRGGFIDITYVRDTADYTFYLFNRTVPMLGQAGWTPYSEKLDVRHVQLNALTPPVGVRQCCQLTTQLAGHLAFEIAQWHEITQRYGFQSVLGFSKEIPAFSPEDLYSNLLGARLAINVILNGHSGPLENYNQTMDMTLKQVLTRLMVATRGETEVMSQRIDGNWWSNHWQMPNRFLVLGRNYGLRENQLPTPAPFEALPPYCLIIPEQVGGSHLCDLGELQIYPGHNTQALPVPVQYYGTGTFQALADNTCEADKAQLSRIEKQP